MVRVRIRVRVRVRIVEGDHRIDVGIRILFGVAPLKRYPVQWQVPV